MTTRDIKKEEWKSFFDGVSKFGDLDSKCADIEVISLHLGDQIAAEWIPMLGIVYEPRSNILEIGLEGLNHLIHRPKTIHVEERGSELLSIHVTDEDEVQHIIRLRSPLMLAPPAKS
ncbi:hypothetical protein SAMN04515617_11674 [Collimonas sp. OK242]|jgi:hypothetical protein|uniref:DUF5335 family protein n=1 Tax=Collimonas sp. OK242 TaxID=1798195 RepID=UPI0008949C52|nr:DUF5335 family protein [Collimonas sp. OK242]SDY55683.1 hypothetical protein SAMN04515617_11674 [Collimonas sp. OK242]